MLKNQNIIYFSNDWNADNRTSAHHIARHLARQNRLLYVESSGLRAPTTSGHDLKRLLRKLIRCFSGARRVEEHVYVISPVLIPLHRYRWVRILNTLWLTLYIRFMCQRHGFKRPIMWVIIPHMGMLRGHLTESLVVYYCVDDFSSLPGVESDQIRVFDQDLTAGADIVFTPSEPLYNKKRVINEKTVLSPHGVDVAHFAFVTRPTTRIADDISALSHPVAGFVGLVENWVDLELIAHCARTKPDWTFIIVGRLARDTSLCEGLANIYFLGARPYATLPRYIKAFDICLLPYVLNDQVHNANPIKLREYLASGKPIVSVRTPEIEKFSDVLTIADSYEAFAAALDEVLAGATPEKVRARQLRVADSSWGARCEEIFQHVGDALKKTQGHRL